jgi:hypothetical protein
MTKLSQQTIIRCFDKGQLGGYRVPGSKFRRIPREALIKFIEDFKLPTPDELADQHSRQTPASK